MAKGVKTGGRVAGTPNKITADLKAAVLVSFDRVGGADYLARQATENPGSYMSLLGRVLPMQVTGDGAGITINIVKHGEGK